MNIQFKGRFKHKISITKIFDLKDQRLYCQQFEYVEICGSIGQADIGCKTLQAYFKGKSTLGFGLIEGFIKRFLLVKLLIILIRS